MTNNVVSLFSKRPVSVETEPVSAPSKFLSNDKLHELVDLSKYDIIRTFIGTLLSGGVYATIPEAYRDILSAWINHDPNTDEETLVFGTEYREKLVPQFGIQKHISLVWVTVDYCDAFKGDWDRTVTLEEMQRELLRYRSSFPLYHTPFVRLWDAVLLALDDLQKQGQILLQETMIEGGLFGTSFYVPVKTNAGWIRIMIIFDILPLILDEQARLYSQQCIKFNL